MLTVTVWLPPSVTDGVGVLTAENTAAVAVVNEPHEPAPGVHVGPVFAGWVAAQPCQAPARLTLAYRR